MKKCVLVLALGILVLTLLTGCGGGSASSDTPVLEAPANVIAVAGDTKVQLAWDNSVGASQYRVYMKKNQEANYQALGVTTTNNYLVSNLENNQLYYFVVTAMNSGGESKYSKDISAVPASGQENSQFIKGADISYIQQLEDNGGVFRDNGTPGDLLDILKNHGINYIRLRIWLNPSNYLGENGGYCDKTRTLQMAKRIKEKGMNFLLDFHYSDSWADPGQQRKPAAWSNLTLGELKTAVYQYSKDIITSLKDQGTLPDMVQIGNEIDNGILWDTGKIGDDTQWTQFADLLKSGIQGVKDALSSGQTVKIMLHIAKGGDNAGSRWFFDKIAAKNVPFDVIGLSYYPWWHGTNLSDVQSNLNDLAQRYSKEVMITETGYPWTLAFNDDMTNFVSSTDNLIPEYAPTVQGQKAYLMQLMNTVKNVPSKKGIGVFYWAPEYVSVPAVKSCYENIALFDFQGNALDSMNAFKTF